ncbi:unnamed protein product [Musa acuminata subsp. burmannicoides]
MGCTSRACLVVAASMSAVEALKDQAGLCRWNYVVRSLQQRAKSSMGSLSQAKRTSYSVDRSRRGWQAAAEKRKQSEEALRTVILIHMASASKASMIVAASVAAVEALKDQAGLCRWNYALRSLHGRAKRSMAPFSRAKRMSSSSIDQWRRGGEEAVERARRTEESMSKLIYLDSWGPK